MIDRVRNFNQVITESEDVRLDLINRVPRGELHHDKLDPDYYFELKDDIKKYGVKEPITLNYYVESNTLTLADGHHRLALASELNVGEIPVNIRVIWDKGVESGEPTFHPPKKLDLEPYIRRRYQPSNIKPSEIGLT